MKTLTIICVAFILSGCGSVLGQINCNGHWVDCYDNCYCPPVTK